jgi:hypothetical protein
MPPLPSSIATASPNPSEDTEVKLNSHRAQEEANVLGINNADAITKLQVQVPNNTLNNPDSDSTSKTVRDDSERTGNSDLSHHHPCDARGFSSGISNDRKFVHDPGGIIFSIKDVSACDDSDSISSSSNNASCNADAHFNFDHDHNKTVSPASDIDTPPLDFMQVNHLIDTPPHSADNLLAILPANSRCTNVQCPSPP